MAGSAVNLSLLSRGIGEIKRNGHEKIDVVLEPEVRVAICASEDTSLISKI